MKKMVMFSLTLVLFISSFAFTSYSKAKVFKKADVKLDYNASNLSSLINDSDYIILADVSKDRSMVTYGEVDFVITNTKVKQSLKGSVNDKDIVRILQTDYTNEDPLLTKGDTVLLFLEKYDGPITENAYVIKGLYQGNYKYSNGKFLSGKNNNEALSKEINELTLDDLSNKIKNSK